MCGKKRGRFTLRERFRAGKEAVKWRDSLEKELKKGESGEEPL